MNARERVLAMMRGEAVDRLPLMPITMMFAADQAGVPYGRALSGGVGRGVSVRVPACRARTAG